jgi:hypothetical protein
VGREWSEGISRLGFEGGFNSICTSNVSLDLGQIYGLHVYMG